LQWLSAVHERIKVRVEFCPTHAGGALGQRLGGGQGVRDVAPQRLGLLIKPQRLLLQDQQLGKKPLVFTACELCQLDVEIVYFIDTYYSLQILENPSLLRTNSAAGKSWLYENASVAGTLKQNVLS
jgi:hypothetical protein